MDNLEKFIRENRPDFDSGVPSLDVWANLDRHLDRQRPSARVVWMKRLRVAAAVLVLVTAGGFGGAYLTNSSKSVESLADVSPEHAEMERYFNTQVEEKLAKLASYKQDGIVKADIQELDETYNQLKHELENAPEGAEEKIVQAMIETYQTKINILEQVLEKVEKVNPTNPTNLNSANNEVSL
ncbi:MAG: hypothetical protein K9J37_14130 [Saprospiraceae bacterium]|nr:hypothetical protein [Saprospiraceae bacterium]MCF8251044.1 hypothetical protein [Saprospiraceae bacterium]MCF8280329.1 hypothetical protein [Bacteroidales bacterium]MCF8312900.1 hypothetical protein [Saprospiraceae bacterium]MCF8441303.1 hypothetical protein [Saprospiraceae bacterium]